MRIRPGLWRSAMPTLVALRCPLDVARARSNESVGGYGADGLRRFARRVPATDGDRHEQGQHARRVHLPGDGRRLRRDHGETAHHFPPPSFSTSSTPQRRTGRELTVAFNYRYSPVRSQVKRALLDGVVGEITGHRFPVASRYAPRCRLLPPLAPQQGQLGWPPRTQGDAPLRPRELVAGERPAHRPRDWASVATTARSRPTVSALRRAASVCHGCAAGGQCPFHFDITAREGPQGHVLRPGTA